jgi:hypothetical protein
MLSAKAPQTRRLALVSRGIKSIQWTVETLPRESDVTPYSSPSTGSEMDQSSAFHDAGR